MGNLFIRHYYCHIMVRFFYCDCFGIIIIKVARVYQTIDFGNYELWIFLENTNVWVFGAGMADSISDSSPRAKFMKTDE
jgi:hypothetical protein